MWWSGMISRVNSLFSPIIHASEGFFLSRSTSFYVKATDAKLVQLRKRLLKPKWKTFMYIFLLVVLFCSFSAAFLIKSVVTLINDSKRRRRRRRSFQIRNNWHQQKIVIRPLNHEIKFKHSFMIELFVSPTPLDFSNSIQLGICYFQ